MNYKPLKYLSFVERYDLIFGLSSKSRSLFFLFLSLFLFLSSNALKASNFRDYEVVNAIVKRCFQDSNYCNDALLKIYNYQKNAASERNFPCQTRLLGLEANLIMAMNYNIKKKEAKSIIDAVRKHC